MGRENDFVQAVSHQDDIDVGEPERLANAIHVGLVLVVVVIGALYGKKGELLLYRGENTLISFENSEFTITVFLSTSRHFTGNT